MDNNTISPAGFKPVNSKSNIPIQKLSPEQIAKLKDAQENIAEALKKVKEMLEKTQKDCEPFKKEVLKKFKKEILAISLLPPAGKDKNLDVFITLKLEGEFEEKLKKKNDIDKIILEISKKKLKNLKVVTALHDEIWEMALKGKHDFISTLAMAISIYDNNFLKPLRAVEIHKKMVLEKFEKYVVSYVLSGSVVRGEATEESDIDTFIVIDDTDVTRMTSQELKSRLRGIIWGMADEAAIAAGVKKAPHSQVYVLTDMWDNIRSSNPVIFTFLRDGVPLYDRGMFAPWKLLLRKGKITPTPESIESYIKSGNELIERTKQKLKAIAMEDFHWALITPTQGVLMSLGISAPAPKQAAEVMRKHLVKPGLLEEKYVKIWEEINQVRKDIEHDKIKEVSAKQIEDLMSKSEDYLKRLDKLVKDVEIKTSKKQIAELYDKSVEDMTALLKTADIKLAGNLIDTFKKEIVDKKLASSRYLEVLKQIEDLKKDGKADKKLLDSLHFEQIRLSKEAFEYIRAEKGNKFDKFKISATYGDKKADIWVLTTMAFIIEDAHDPNTPIKKYVIEKTGALSNPVKSDLKELNKELEKFAGTSTQLTNKTIESLKKVLSKDIKITIGA